MRGRQLVCIKSHKPKTLSLNEDPIGYIKGTSEEIQVISPKDRRRRNQIYLKSISPNLPSVKPIESNSSSVTDSYRPLSNQQKLTFHTNFSFSVHKKEKYFKADPNSKFSMYYHAAEEKELTKLNKELFPKEFIEEIEYIPDYTPSCVAKNLELDLSGRLGTGNRHPDMNTIGNILKSRQGYNQINMKKLRRNQFTTYSVGWTSFYDRPPVTQPRKYLKNTQVLLEGVYK
jgi:hypothetical protein